MRKVDGFIRGALVKAWAALREGRLSASPLWWVKALGLHWRELGADGDAAPVVPHPTDWALTDESYRRWLQSRAGRSRAEASRGMESLVSIVVLVHDPSRIAEVVESVRSQSFKNWELSLVRFDAADGSHDRDADERGRQRCASVTIGELKRADGTWLPPGTGDFVVLLDTDTLLAPDALRHLAGVLADTAADWIYTDDDCRDEAGLRRDPNLKGAFSPELALVDDYATRLAAVRRRAIEQAGGLRSDCGDAQLYDLLLRVAEGAAAIRHAPGVACHRRQLASGVLGSHHRQAAERLLRKRMPATMDVSRASTSGPALQRVKWPDELVADLRVTIVIPTRDRLDLLERCIVSLRQTVDPDRVRLLIVDDHSREEGTHTFLRQLEADPRLPCRVLRPTSGDAGFNYSRLMNRGSREVDTPLMLHLNNDIEATTAGWVEQMAGWLAFPEIGVVGAKLLHPDGSMQHAGVMVSPPFGPEHMFRRLEGGDAGYQWLPHRLRNVSAVTGACLMTRTALFQELDGFDELNLPVQFNDVDFCLRAAEAGKRIVYEPAAVLIHRMSASRGRVYDHRENSFFFKKYGHYRDPFVSPYLDLHSICGPTPLVATGAD